MLEHHFVQFCPCSVGRPTLTLKLARHHHFCYNKPVSARQEVVYGR
jgi:hypothetical protein